MTLSPGRTLGLLAVLLAALALVVPVSAQQATESPTPTSTNTLTVAGSGTAYGAPDVAYVELGVQTVDPDLSTAFSKTGQAITNVLKALQDLGIAADDIQTSGVNVNPQNQFDNNGNPTGTPTYVVSNTVEVTVRKIDQVESVLTSAIAAGANTINGLSFGILDSSSLEQQARAQAIQQAQSRAQQLASGLGVTLGKPIAISEVPQSTTPLPFAVRGVAAMSASAGQPVSQGQVSVEVDIQVTFSIS